MHEAKRKDAYFAELYSLKEDSEDDDERTRTKELPEISFTTPQTYIAVKKIIQSPTKPPALVQNQPPARVSASLTQDKVQVATTPAFSQLNIHPSTNKPSKPSPLSTSFIAETPISLQQDLIPEPQRSTSDPVVPTTSDMAKTKFGKRKREVKLRPERDQILKGLKFYYIPNDDINPARGIRIHRALEHGVEWTKSWIEGEVTHIVVDDNISYDEAIKSIKMSSVAENITLVNHNYPLDCITSKAIHDPDQRKYRVKGDPRYLPNQVSSPPQAPQAIDASLELKPGKHDYVHPKETPHCSFESSQDNNLPSVVDKALQTQAQTTLQLISSTTTPANHDTQEKLNTRSDIHRRHTVDNLNAQTSTAQPLMATSSDTRCSEFQMTLIEVKQLGDLPLEEFDDDDTIPVETSIDSDCSGDEERRQAIRHPKKKNKLSKGGLSQESFRCMNPGSSQDLSSNPNKATVDKLQEMLEYYKRQDDTWRILAYRRCISTLQKLDNYIRTAEEAVQLPFIGRRLAAKIEEIVNTGRLRRLENGLADARDQIEQRFLNIYGVGLVQAGTWIQQGYSTLEDLKASVDLTPNQRLGIEHYDDLKTRIPREEVTALSLVVQNAAKEIDPEIEIIVGGSYRRGKQDSGDIDCIVTKLNTRNAFEIMPALNRITRQLENSGFLVAALATPNSDSGTKWHGCCVLPGASPPVWRRIDLLLVPASELGAALIYFTGDDIYNRSIRLLARKKGMRLNQRGLYKDVMRGADQKKLNEGELLEGADERKIHSILGVPWTEPHERICG